MLLYVQREYVHIQLFPIVYSRNVAWASTCNTVGQTAGYFMGNVVFMALESAELCRNYLGTETSLVTLDSKCRKLNNFGVKTMGPCLMQMQ